MNTLKCLLVIAALTGITLAANAATLTLSSVTLPQSGIGLNGFGGSISSVDLFKCEVDNVPDGGATVMLLGGALAALVLVRRYLKR
jgi:VPDSG-CTERM motif